MCRCEDASDTRVSRNLILERRNEKRSVWMLQYTGWPDTGVPQTEAETRDFIGTKINLCDICRLLIGENQKVSNTSYPHFAYLTSIIVRCCILLICLLLPFSTERLFNFSLPSASLH